MNKIVRFSVPLIVAFLFIGLLLLLVGESSHAVANSSPFAPEGSILVTTLEDELNSDGDCSLREAITAANDNTEVDTCPAGDAVITDTITFDVAGTITVTSPLEVATGGPLVIDGGVGITTSGGDSTRVWWVESGSRLSLDQIAIINGRGYGGGGGITNEGILLVNDCTLSGNHNNGIPPDRIPSTLAINAFSTNGIYSDIAINPDKITIPIRTESPNPCSTVGGAIMASYGSTTMIVDSKFSGNGSCLGGAIINNGILTIINSIFNENDAFLGGGIANSGILIVTNSTLSGNSTFYNGGGIYNAGLSTLINTTLSGNHSDEGIGGGIYIYSGVVTSTNTIIANSITGGDCYGILLDDGHNISSDDTCSFDPANGSLPNTNPLLGPLQDNGGPTFTHALLPGSPAIDAGDDAHCPSTDQRGVTRPLDGDGDGLAVCDIGSYELEGPYVAPSLVTITGPSEGYIGSVTYFTATVEPISTTLPLTYTWQASDHPPITHTSGQSDTAGWAWEITGTYAITVTASNLAGEISNNHVITITKPVNNIFLPLVINSGGTLVNPNSSLPEGGILGGFVIIGFWISRKWRR